jgi:hypothetical protein
MITIWNHPNNPTFGNLNDILNTLDNYNIKYETKKSDMQNHTAIAVQPQNVKIASSIIEKKFGRRI